MRSYFVTVKGDDPEAAKARLEAISGEFGWVVYDGLAADRRPVGPRLFLIRLEAEDEDDLRRLLDLADLPEGTKATHAHEGGKYIDLDPFE